MPCALYNFNSRVKIAAVCTKKSRKSRGYYKYTYIENYLITKDLEIKHSNILQCASQNISKDLFEEAANYNFYDMRKFEITDLLGYYTERYSSLNKILANAKKKTIQKLMTLYQILLMVMTN